MQRGEVWWADLPQPAGRRPVLLLSRNRAYRVRTSVTVAVVTRTVRDIPVEVLVGPEDGMPVPCVVNTDDILTIPKTLLRDRVTVLSSEKMAAVASAVRFALDLPQRPAVGLQQLHQEQLVLPRQVELALDVTNRRHPFHEKAAQIKVDLAAFPEATVYRPQPAG